MLALVCQEGLLMSVKREGRKTIFFLLRKPIP